MGRKRLLVLGSVAAVLVLVVVYQNLGSGGGTGHAAAQLESPDGAVREAAVQTLATDASTRSLAVLSQTVQHQDATVAIYSLAALGRAGSAQYIPRIQTALGDARPEVREAAVNALSKMDGEVDTAPVLQMLGEKEPTNVRAAAAQFIGRKFVWDGFPQLLKGLRDASVEVRASSYAALARMVGRDYHFNPNDPPAKREQVVRVIERSLAGTRPGTGRVETGGISDKD